ncbi:hypothetical protein [Aeromicrobium sp. 179-A 4D2 NHS]|uniref:hypothetical protein n=1 Tax=Aeromicrobium sp. 179-A 4D2 NHS TaxID=3142375 RepID=UPI0039A09FF0
MSVDPTGVLVSDAIAQYKSVKALAVTSLTEDMLMAAVEALLAERGTVGAVVLSPAEPTLASGRPAPETKSGSVDLIAAVATGRMSVPEALDDPRSDARVVVVAARKAQSLQDPGEFTAAVTAIANHVDTHPRMLKAFVADERLDEEMRWALESRIEQ